jgi:hypothetical protein
VSHGRKSAIRSSANDPPPEIPRGENARLAAEAMRPEGRNSPERRFRMTLDLASRAADDSTEADIMEARHRRFPEAVTRQTR